MIYEGLALLPHFNPDLDVEPAPGAVADLRARVGEADALLIASPEYARGVAGSLKNALDWLVSGPEMVNKPVGAINASPRATEAYAALVGTLRTMSASIVDEASLVLPLFQEHRTIDAILAEPELVARLRGVLTDLIGAGTRPP
jgi:NAD(P)H-dependent FMN reductase